MTGDHRPVLRVLSTRDVARLDVSIEDVLSTVEDAYRALYAGRSSNPRKLTVKPADDHSVAYAMLGRDGARDIVAVKTSYKHGLDRGRDEQRYYTTLTIYDDSTGLPVAMMDCARIGSLRTPAVTALLARECANQDAHTALLIGTGTQGRLALPFLLAARPDLDRLLLHGSHPDGIAAVRAELHARHPDRDVELVDDLETAAKSADIVIATAGGHTRAAVESSWLQPGAVSILVGHGLSPSTLHRADRVVATSGAQMRITGVDMVDADGQLRAPDVELPDILGGDERGRTSSEQRIFAYNSGLVITDIALGHRFAQLAIEAGLGTEVAIWN